MSYIEKLSSFLEKTGIKDSPSSNIAASANAFNKLPQSNLNILQTAFSNELPKRRGNLRLLPREQK